MPRKREASAQRLSEKRYNHSDHRRMIVRLKKHIEKHGPLSHTKHESVDATLVLWARYVRSHILEISPKLMDQLLEAGFFNPYEEGWLQRFYELKNTLRISKGSEELKLCKDIPKYMQGWIARQRSNRRKLDTYKIALLQSIGFQWKGFDAEKRWNERFDELVEFYKAHGHCDVTVSWENKTLANWVANLRSGKFKLDGGKVDKLNGIGFSWEPLKETWEKHFEELKAYIKEFGDPLVPAKWKRNPQLAKWVVRQRRVYRLGEIEEERTERLRALGFVWNVEPERWEERFAELVAYKETHGDCDVPSEWPENLALGTWVHGQRHYGKARLSKERYERLNRLGFTWTLQQDRYDRTYQSRLKDLKTFKKQFGNCKVPKPYSAVPELGSWVSRLRLSKGVGLSESQKSELDRLGFIWNPVHSEYWEGHFQKLKEYIEKYGDAAVPQRWPENEQLANWVTVQRQKYRKGTLNAELVERLNAVGFVWNGRDYLWNQRYRELQVFKDSFGHCRVPFDKGWPENPSLGNWVCTQRKWWKRLSPERRKRLKALGMREKVDGPIPTNVQDYVRALKQANSAKKCLYLASASVLA